MYIIWLVKFFIIFLFYKKHKYKNIKVPFFYFFYFTLIFLFYLIVFYYITIIHINALMNIELVKIILALNNQNEWGRTFLSSRNDNLFLFFTQNLRKLGLYWLIYSWNILSCVGYFHESFFEFFCSTPSIPIDFISQKRAAWTFFKTSHFVLYTRK